MTKDYDSILEDYEKRGIIPMCPHHYNTIIHNPVYTCPYCHTEFWVGKGFEKIMHCPHCCMEIQTF